MFRISTAQLLLHCESNQVTQGAQGFWHVVPRKFRPIELGRASPVLLDPFPFLNQIRQRSFAIDNSATTHKP